MIINSEDVERVLVFGYSNPVLESRSNQWLMRIYKPKFGSRSWFSISGSRSVADPYLSFGCPNLWIQIRIDGWFRSWFWIGLCESVNPETYRWLILIQVVDIQILYFRYRSINDLFGCRFFYIWISECRFRPMIEVIQISINEWPGSGFWIQRSWFRIARSQTQERYSDPTIRICIFNIGIYDLDPVLVSDIWIWISDPNQWLILDSDRESRISGSCEIWIQQSLIYVLGSGTVHF